LHDRLTLSPQITWSELERVERFLRDEGVTDGEVNCSDMGALPLYHSLGCRPATRFTILRKSLVVLQAQRRSIYAELADSRQRYMVCDGAGDGFRPAAWQALFSEETEQKTPSAQPYPWSDAVVFRSGRYVVLRLSGVETPRWLEATFEL
jgi:hypothetical protein